MNKQCKKTIHNSKDTTDTAARMTAAQYYLNSVFSRSSWTFEQFLMSLEVVVSAFHTFTAGSHKNCFVILIAAMLLSRCRASVRVQVVWTACSTHQVAGGSESASACCRADVVIACRLSLWCRRVQHIHWYACKFQLFLESINDVM